MRDYVLSLVERYVGKRWRPSGESNISLNCPLGTHDDRSPSFSINVDLGVFHCFACHESGGIKKLLRLLGLPPQEVDSLTKDIIGSLKSGLQSQKLRRQAEWTARDPFRAEVDLSEAVARFYENNRKNTPHTDPTRLSQYGFMPQTLDYVEVGWDGHQDRVIYPVRDLYGNLAGVVGGATSRMQVPKYKVYLGQRQDSSGTILPADYGPWFDEQYPEYSFSNHRYLWNFDRVYPTLFFSQEVPTIVIVEGFKACMWLIQCGFLNTVALMGSSMSPMQLHQLHRLRVNVVLFLDNDPTGRDQMPAIYNQIRNGFPGVFCARYPRNVGNCQPDHLSPDQVREAVMSASRPTPATERNVR